MTEDEMVGWRHLLNGHGFGWTGWISLYVLNKKPINEFIYKTEVELHMWKINMVMGWDQSTGRRLKHFICYVTTHLMAEYIVLSCAFVTI